MSRARPRSSPRGRQRRRTRLPNRPIVSEAIFATEIVAQRHLSTLLPQNPLILTGAPSLLSVKYSASHPLQFYLTLTELTAYIVIIHTTRPHAEQAMTVRA